MRRKVLITGASGFIGNFLVREAIARNYQIYAAIRPTSDINKLLDPRIKLVTMDFSDIAGLIGLLHTLPRFDFVIHNAGLTQSRKKRKLFEVNSEYTRNFAESLKKANKVPERFIYISSLSAFGPGKPETIEPISNSSIANPVTYYGKSKLEAEKYLKEDSKIPYIIIRPTAVYGPGEKNIFKTIKLIHFGIHFKIGFKKQFFSFIYVQDLSRLIFETLEWNIKNKEYFASDGDLYTSDDLGNIVAKHLNKKAIHISLPVFLAKAIAGVNQVFAYFFKLNPILTIDKVNELAASNWNCDTQPLFNDFRYKAHYKLDRGMKETIDWYKENEMIT